MTPVSTHADELRRQQIEDGRRLAAEEGQPTERLPGRLGVRRDFPRAASGQGGGSDRSGKPMIKAPPKGHEAFLKALETSGAQIELEKCDGSKITGTVKHSDHYTISMRVTDIHGDVRDRVIFKHDVSEFSALTPRTEGYLQ